VRYGWARGVMQEWVSSALHVSKEIRNTAGLLLKELEIEDLCISYLKSKRPDLGKERVLVLGSGVVGTTIVERLVRMGLACHWCYHITRPRVPDSWTGKVELCTFDDLRASLSRSGVIVCATDSPHLVLTQEHAAVLDGGRSVLIVDLTMPRNVDPALDGSSPDLEVADLEDLKEWHDGETVDMAKVFELSREVVDRHRDMYEKLAGGALAAG